MKPIRLTLEGINSFEQAQTVDFSKLTTQGIFGIFGPTGSGKSTLLDGVILALYGNIPRYDGHQTSSFLNVNCESGFVSFSFSLDEKQNTTTYTVERFYKKASKKNDYQSAAWYKHKKLSLDTGAKRRNNRIGRKQRDRSYPKG